jgi:hypothetical protein
MIYNTLTVPNLRYVREIWTIKPKDKSRITVAEIKCKRTTKYTGTGED